MEPVTLFSLLFTAVAAVGKNVIGKPGQRRRRRRGQREQVYRRGNEPGDRSERRSARSGISRRDTN